MKTSNGGRAVVALVVLMTASIPACGGARPVVPDGLRATLETYLKAFELGDASLMEASLSETFFRETGGEPRWTHVLRTQRAAHASVSLENLEVQRLGNPATTDDGPGTRVLVQFDVRANGAILPRDACSWLLVVKDARGQWRIDDQCLIEDPGR